MRSIPPKRMPSAEHNTSSGINEVDKKENTDISMWKMPTRFHVF
jgi:hypothetical protein